MPCFVADKAKAKLEMITGASPKIAAEKGHSMMMWLIGNNVLLGFISYIQFDRRFKVLKNMLNQISWFVSLSLIRPPLVFIYGRHFKVCNQRFHTVVASDSFMHQVSHTICS